MLLSIIIVSYNTETILENCLRSIFEKIKSVNFELIIVDNNSSDNSVRKTKKLFPKVKIIENKENVGFGIANNQAAKKAKGKYLLFLNSDTEVLSDNFKQTIEWIYNFKQEAIIGCQIFNKNKTIQPSAGFFPSLKNLFYWAFFIDDIPILNLFLKPFHQENRTFYNKEREVDWVTGAFLLMKKSVFNRLGGFDEKIFMHMEEVDLCYRAKDKGIRIFYLPFIKIIHFRQGLSREWLARAISNEIGGIIYFFNKHRSSFQKFIARIILKIGILNRIIFSAILKNDAKRQIYHQIIRGF